MCREGHSDTTFGPVSRFDLLSRRSGTKELNGIDKLERLGRGSGRSKCDPLGTQKGERSGRVNTVLTMVTAPYSGRKKRFAKIHEWGGQT